MQFHWIAFFVVSVPFGVCLTFETSCLKCPNAFDFPPELFMISYSSCIIKYSMLGVRPKLRAWCRGVQFYIICIRTKIFFWRHCWLWVSDQSYFNNFILVLSFVCGIFLHSGHFVLWFSSFSSSKANGFLFLSLFFLPLCRCHET